MEFFNDAFKQMLHSMAVYFTVSDIQRVVIAASRRSERYAFFLLMDNGEYWLVTSLDPDRGSSHEYSLYKYPPPIPSVAQIPTLESSDFLETMPESLNRLVREMGGGESHFLPNMDY